MATVKVCYWPKGYACEAGTSKIELEEGTDYLAVIKSLSRDNMFATISSIDKPRTAPVEVFSKEYIREMSQGG